MVRSMGYEPGEMSRRLKLLFLVRLIPLAERNYNLVELGPRGTGKSYVVQEVSPYSALLTGGTTVANLFGHMSGRQKGMVQIWDVVGFDEVADLQKMPKEVITTMKTYCESGTFQRGQEAVSGDASIAMFGNTNQPIDVMVQTGHLFAPMPDIIRDDMAFIDRLHFYLPGWEIPKMRNDLFTDHYGFVVDYLAEALREMRKHNFTEIIDRHFSLGAHLNARDRKAVRKTVSGLMKILFPHGEVTQEELAEILEFALEGRRRVKEQLKKMGSFEYYHTSFSYTLQETGEEKFVGVPEQGGRDLISTDPLAPGTVYSAGVTSDGTVGLYRVEVSVSSGTGKLKMAGGVAGAMKESVQRAFSYLQAKKTELGIARDLDVSDLHVEVIDLLAQPRRGRGRRRLLRRLLLGAAEGAREPRASRPRRHERPGQHQAAPLAHRAASGREGQRRGTKGPLRASFAAVRVRVADGTPTRAGERSHQHLPGNEEVWLVGERRSTGEHKYYLSNLPTETPLKILAATIKARWLCEQAHQQLKEELGLDHFEGRSWSGLHRHALMSMIAFLYLQHRRLEAAKRGKKQDRPAASAEPTRDTQRHHRALQPRSLPTMSLQAQELARAARG